MRVAFQNGSKGGLRLLGADLAAKKWQDRMDKLTGEESI
jgi:hypothetical protein